MATDAGFVEFILDQISDAGVLRGKKMFGEYMVYCDDRPALLVCDNTAFVKIMPETTELFRARGIAPAVGDPYPGARPHYVLDVENGDLATEITRLLARILPVPKKKKAGNGK